MEDVLGRGWGAALIIKIKNALNSKVGKEEGKGLSANDFTDVLKSGYDTAVADVADLKKAGAEKNVIVGVKVNGTALVPDSTRNVDVTVPTDAQIEQKIEGYGYQTASQVETKITGKGYQTSDQVQSAINSALSGVTGIDIQVVESLPTTGSKGVIYLVAHAHGSGDSYDEYVWLSGKKTYEKIGNTDVDLSGYLQKTDLTTLTEADLNTMWGA